MEYWILGIALWGICGYISYDIGLNGLQQNIANSPELKLKMLPNHKNFVLKRSFLGPLNLIVVLMIFGWHK